MVKLSELRNRKGNDLGLRIDITSPGSTSDVKSPSTWSAGSSPPSQLPPTPKSALRSRRPSFTERHGGKTLTRKFSKKSISFDESIADKSPLDEPMTPLSPQPMSPQVTTNLLSVPEALKGVFTTAQIATFRKLFDYYDKDASGSIDKQELGLVLEEMGEKPTVQRVNALMLEVDFDGNGVIDFEEFLHVMNDKRGGDSSFSSIVDKVEKRLNPFLLGDIVSLMYKGEKVSGTLSKKQGPFWVIELENGTVASGVASSALNRPISYKARISQSEIPSEVQSPRLVPPTAPKPIPVVVAPPPTVPTPVKRASLGRMSISEMFKQVGEPDSDESSLSSNSTYSTQKSLPSAPEPKIVPVNKAETKAHMLFASKPSSAKKVPMKSPSKILGTSEPVAERKSERKFERQPETKTETLMPDSPPKNDHENNSNMSRSIVLEPDHQKEQSQASPTSPPRNVVVPKELASVFSAEQAMTLRNLFDFYEKDGAIKKSEFRLVLGQMGFGEPILSNLTMNSIIDKVDRGDGKLHFESFLHGIALTKTTQDSTREPKARPKKLDIPPIGKRQSSANKEKEEKEDDVNNEEENESSDDEEGERRRTWFLKESMTPREEVWEGSPRTKSPRSPRTPASAKSSPMVKDRSPRTPKTPSSPSTGPAATPNIDGVLASLFPGAKIQQSSNGIVMITPHLSPIQPLGGKERSSQDQQEEEGRRPSRLSEIIGRYSLSPILKYHDVASTPLSRESNAVEEQLGDRRGHASRGKDLIENILSSKKSEQKRPERSSNTTPLHPPSMASSRETPSSIADSATPHKPQSPLTSEVITDAAVRLQRVAMSASSTMPKKDLNQSFAAEMSNIPHQSNKPNSPTKKLVSPSSIKTATSKLLSAGGTLSSFSMHLYDVMGCVISAVGRVVHVIEDGQATRGGVTCGDFVIGIGKYKVNSIDSITSALEKCRRRAEYKVIQREIARRKDSGSFLSDMDQEEPIAETYEIDREDQVLVILMTPGNAAKSITSGDKSYYAVL